jgi:hypothetical protein
MHEAFWRLDDFIEVCGVKASVLSATRGVNCSGNIPLEHVWLVMMQDIIQRVIVIEAGFQRVTVIEAGFQRVIVIEAGLQRYSHFEALIAGAPKPRM